MAKERVPLTDDVANQVMYSHSRMCCVCEDQGVGKFVQIHHIDGDPSNNDLQNLAVLCKQHHDEAHSNLYMSRGLASSSVTFHRDQWVERVGQRRARADEISLRAAESMAEPAVKSAQPSLTWEQLMRTFNSAKLARLAYMRSLPIARKTVMQLAQPEWNTGIRPRVKNASFSVIDVLEWMCVHLATWYPANHFGNQEAKHYFAEYLRLRWEWHTATETPLAGGSYGYITEDMIAGGVMNDMENAVVAMVRAMSLLDRWDFDFLVWQREWDEAGKPPEPSAPSS